MAAFGQLAYAVGFATERGRREENQDYVGCAQPGIRDVIQRGVVAAVADGMGGNRGGRVAAETCLGMFMEAFYSGAETWSVEQAAYRALDAANRWIHAMGRRDAGLANMGTTFSALILRGRRAHLAHIGDTRIYRLRAEQLELLTTDHTLAGPERDHILYRAVGLEGAIRLDYAVYPLDYHDRFLLCSDGLYTALRHPEIAAVLMARAVPQASAEALVAAALQRGTDDNVTALVLDIVALPKADRNSVQLAVANLPIRPRLPQLGEILDGFRIERCLSSGRYSALFVATDSKTDQSVVLKLPQPRVASDAAYRAAFSREAWIGSRVKSPWVAEILEQAPERQTCLYSVMPFYSGPTLEAHLRQNGRLGLAQVVEIALQLCRAAHALHRQSIVHRDIKPDNVLLPNAGGLKLLDLGIARLPAWDEEGEGSIPGTPSFMAPELFQGERGSVASDVYAIGVTLYYVLSGGAYPYGEIEPFTTPRFGKPKPLASVRPDLPVWLDAVVLRAVALNPAERHADAIELGYELESGMAKGGGRAIVGSRPLYDRNPVAFWRCIAIALAFLLIVCLYWLRVGACARAEWPSAVRASFSSSLAVVRWASQSAVR